MTAFQCTRRSLAAGLALAAALAATPALAQTTLERAKADGYIRVGFANEAPFGFATPDGKLTGEAAAGALECGHASSPVVGAGPDSRVRPCLLCTTNTVVTDL